jgi:hypothetical protein
MYTTLDLKYNASRRWLAASRGRRKPLSRQVKAASTADMGRAIKCPARYCVNWNSGTDNTK